jgi:hypothetical protein
MGKVVLMTTVKDVNKANQKRLVLESKLAEVNNKLDLLELSKKQLITQRETLERHIYTPRQQAEISIRREAEKLTW